MTFNQAKDIIINGGYLVAFGDGLIPWYELPQDEQLENWSGSLEDYKQELFQTFKDCGFSQATTNQIVNDEIEHDVYIFTISHLERRYNIS